MLAAARDLRARSFGPATAKYRELGTLANLLAFNAIATLPTRNFQAATFAEAPALAAEDLAEARGVARDSCASCSIGCEHIYKGAGGRKTRVEYENVFALGPMCAVSDPDAVLEASGRCDELGLDTISAGGTIAWAMECAERGLIDAPWLRFGDADALLRAIDEIGAREGLGALLGRGLPRGGAGRRPGLRGLRRRTSRAWSCRATSRAPCRRWRSGWPSTRGAPTTTAPVPTRPTSSGRFDRLAGGEPHVAAAIETEDRAAVMDSLILCKFLRGVFEDPFAEWARLLGSVTGWDVDGRRARGDRAAHRARQARLQRARGMDALRRRPAGAVADRDARGLAPVARPCSPASGSTR